jgi:hypothetical protein
MQYLKTHVRATRACNMTSGRFALREVQYKDGRSYSSDNLFFSCLSQYDRERRK